MELGNTSKLKILIVDDSKNMREVLTTLLSLEGYWCESAANGLEALEKVKQTHFDLVITDVHMPKMDGVTLAGEITRHFTDLQVIIMTAQLDEHSQRSALTAGAREVLRKPFAISELTARLHKMLHV